MLFFLKYKILRRYAITYQYHKNFKSIGNDQVLWFQIFSKSNHQWFFNKIMFGWKFLKCKLNSSLERQELWLKNQLNTPYLAQFYRGLIFYHRSFQTLRKPSSLLSGVPCNVRKFRLRMYSKFAVARQSVFTWVSQWSHDRKNHLRKQRNRSTVSVDQVPHIFLVWPAVITKVVVDQIIGMHDRFLRPLSGLCSINQFSIMFVIICQYRK